MKVLRFSNTNRWIKRIIELFTKKSFIDNNGVRREENDDRCHITYSIGSNKYSNMRKILIFYKKKKMCLSDEKNNEIFFGEYEN